MSDNTITENPFVELYQITAKRCTDYATIIGFSIGTLKRLKLMTNDSQLITEIDYAITEIENRFSQS
jgi:hypothetical protein